jgi:putative colanic acid biosynthesis glycosyltransferase
LVNNLLPKITIITVVLNGQFVIEKTILSTINQNYTNIEYIIIDGNSMDDTLTIINKHKSSIDIIISEKDFGIYDAMNKGINLSTGQWIIFMNAGDIFFSNNTVKDIVMSIPIHNYDFIYGNNQVIYKSGKCKITQSKPIEKINKGSIFSHQAVLIKSKIQKQNLYNPRQKIAADFEFFYNQYLHNRSFLRIESTIAIIEAGGLSDLNRIDTIVAWWSIVKKSNKINFYFISKIILEILKTKLKNAFFKR